MKTTTLHRLALPAMLLTAAGMCAPAATAAVEAYPLGHDNLMIHVSGTDPLLLLPVQESRPDARVDLLVDGRTEKTFYVRLAADSADYTVPLDIAPYLAKSADGTVTLNVMAEGYMPDASLITTATAFSTDNREKHRPVYHHTPAYGWMNDPNGMFYADGRWHLYYQYNPFGSKWQNMTWGHSSSSDLANWEAHPLAIEPDGLGSIFSGSCVVDSAGTAGYGEGAVVALYTSCGRSQVQSMAVSHDGGLTFKTHGANPVLHNPMEARDPNMFFHAPSGRWVMVLAEALAHRMQVYTSPDLKDWTMQSTFGEGYGCQDGVWECPDLFELPVKGTKEKKWVLVCNINPGGPFGGSATQYFTGSFDGNTFTPDTPSDITKWMDYGKDHYATVSWSGAPDGRRTVIGWMSNWQYADHVPTLQYRSANTLPRDLGLFRDKTDGQTYLSVTPAPEMEAMRGQAVSFGTQKVTAQGLQFPLPADNGGACEIVVTYDLPKASPLLLTLLNARGEEVKMTLDPAKRLFTMDRTASGNVDFDPAFPAVTEAHTHAAPGRARGTLRIFIDRSSIEAFDGDGRFAMTNLVFPAEPYTTLTVATAQGAPQATLKSLEIYPLSTANARK